jgi:hypothetical protein
MLGCVIVFIAHRNTSYLLASYKEVVETAVELIANGNARRCAAPARHQKQTRSFLIVIPFVVRGLQPKDLARIQRSNGAIYSYGT